MEKIYSHIEKLLAEHDYVVVPNFGGFVVQTKPAEILTNRIIPPQATIGFNPLLQHSDGLLAIEIARSEAISYRAAMETIDNEVVKIKKQLDEIGSISIGEMGILSKTDTGHLVFSPIYKADFLPLNFGLYDLHVSQRNGNQIDKHREITFKLPTTRVYKYAAAGMVIFGLLFISPELNDKKHNATASLSTFIIPNTTSSFISDTAKTIAPVNIKDTINLIEESHNFHVIVASLPTQEMAQNYCKELENGKFTNAHVIPPAKTFRVAIESFSNRDAAIEYMENLRKTDSRFETAWVLCNK